MKYVWGYGSVGRAPRSQRGGQRFESAYLHQKNRTAGCRSIFLSIIVRTAELSALTLAGSLFRRVAPYARATSATK